MSNGVPFKLKYYCGERKKFFERKVLIDDDIEIKRKVMAAQFVTLTMGGGRKALMVQKIDGKFIATSGESASVPVYLFGEEYKRAVRTDPTNLWDFRKEAFRPLKKAA